MSRAGGGAITLRLVPELHAQSGVTGVPGQVVNAVGIGGCPLVPWNPAATTNRDGVALFYFEPGTRAGECQAEIRYVDPETGSRLVTDTAVAVVTAGAVAKSTNAVGDSIRATMDEAATGRITVSFWDPFQDQYGNAVPFTAEIVSGPLTLSYAIGQAGAIGGYHGAWDPAAPLGSTATVRLLVGGVAQQKVRVRLIGEREGAYVFLTP